MLATGVLVQAARDAAAGDDKARTWLLHPETATSWGVLAGLDWRMVVSWVDSGCKMTRSVYRRIEGKKAREAAKAGRY